MSNMKNLVILVLAIAVAVLGYLYYDARQRAVSINLPGFHLEAK